MDSFVADEDMDWLYDVYDRTTGQKIKRLLSYRMKVEQDLCQHIICMEYKMLYLDIDTYDKANILLNSLPDEKWGSFKERCRIKYRGGLSFKLVAIELEIENEQEIRSSFKRTLVLSAHPNLRSAIGLRSHRGDGGVMLTGSNLKGILEHERVYEYRRRYPEVLAVCEAYEHILPRQKYLYEYPVPHQKKLKCL